MCCGLRPLEGGGLSRSSNQPQGVTKRKKAQRGTQCQARGCSAVLINEKKTYCQRKHLCQEHMQAKHVRLPGTDQLYRYCFQCGKLQEVELFDDDKKSCRMRLERRRQLPSNHKPRSARSSGSDSRSCSRHTAASTAASSEPLTPIEWDCLMSPAAVDEVLLAFEGSSALLQGPVPCADDNTMSMDILNDLLAAGILESSSPPGSNCSSQDAGPWACPAAAHAPTDPCADAGAVLQVPSMQEAMRAGPALLPGTPSWLQAEQLAPVLAPAAAAAAPAQSAGFDSMLPEYSQALQGDSSQELELMLESELVAALLDSAIAHAPAPPLDPAAQRVSAQLAELLVQDSGLFSPAGQDCQLSTAAPGGLHSQRSISASNYRSDSSSSQQCPDSGDVSVAAIMRSHSSSAATMLAAAGQSPAAPRFGMCFAPAVPYTLPQQLLQGFPAEGMAAAAAPSACSGAPAVPGFLVPAGPMSAQLVPAGCFGQLPAQPFAVPVAMQLQPVYPLMPAHPAGQRPGLFAAHEGRLNAMQQQVRLLHASVQHLKSQLGM